MFDLYRRGGGIRVVATSSEEFGRIVSDIMGADGLREASRKTGLSKTYIGEMREGLVPSTEAVGQFAVGYRLDADLARRLFEAARNVREDINPELLFQIACGAAGISTTDRLRLLDDYRAAVERSRNEQQAA